MIRGMGIYNLDSVAKISRLVTNSRPSAITDQTMSTMRTIGTEPSSSHRNKHKEFHKTFRTSLRCFPKYMIKKWAWNGVVFLGHLLSIIRSGQPAPPRRYGARYGH